MEGQTSTELSLAGQRQAQQLAATLPTASALPTHFYSSPLQRALQTASTLHQALTQANHSIPIQPTAALQEMHQGIFQGLTWAQASAQYPQHCDPLLTTLSWKPVPEAESLIDARTRGQQWLEFILSTHDPGDIIWAVSHAGIMQQLVSVILGCDRTWKIPIHHTALFEFWLAATDWQALSQDRYNPEFWQLKRFNDTAHLR